MKQTQEATPAKPDDLDPRADIREFKAKLRAEMIKRRTIPGYEGISLFSVSEEDVEALQQCDEVRQQMRAELTKRVNEILENRTEGDFIDEALHPSNTERMSVEELGRKLGTS